MKSKVIFCTSNLPLARFIDWYTNGYGHAALVLDNGNWLDSRGSGVRERPPEKNLYRFKVVELPFDIEPAMQTLRGRGYNFKGILAQFFHFRWRGGKAVFCDQAILMACRLVNHQTCDEDFEDKATPMVCMQLIKSHLRGLDGN